MRTVPFKEPGFALLHWIVLPGNADYFPAESEGIMYQCGATNSQRDQECYLCSGYQKIRDVSGQTYSIRTVIMEELVLQNLREMVSFAS